MKFAEHLLAHITPEWRRQYIVYEDMKTMLYEAVENLPTIETADLDEIERLIRAFDEDFLAFCEKELFKINVFYEEKLAEAKRKFDTLRKEMDALAFEGQQNYSNQSGGRIRGSVNRVAGNSIFSESNFRSTINLRNRQVALNNSTGRLNSKSNISFNDPQQILESGACQAGLINQCGRTNNKNRSTESPTGTLSGNANGNNSENEPPCSTRDCSISGTIDRSQRKEFASEFNLELSSINPIQTVALSSSRLLDGQHGNTNYGGIQKQTNYKNYGTLSTSRSVDRKKLNDLKLAFSEFYLSLVLLQNYQRLNFTGFRKILKKHDKLIGNEEGKRWHRTHVESAFFHTNNDVDKIIEDTENIVTVQLESGDRQKAMKRLRVPPLNDVTKPWTAFRVGFSLGAFLVLAIGVTLTGVFQQTGEDWRIIFRLYRSSLFIIFFIFLVGINIYGWRMHGVNHVLIFELDPRDHLGSQDLLEIAFSFGLLWCISVLLFLWSGPIGIPPLINPMILNGIIVVYLLNPTKTFHYTSRYWLLCCIARTVTAPFHRVRFSDFWLADQLNSLVPFLLDIEYTTCFYLSSTNLYGNTAAVDRCVIREPKDLLIRAIVASLPAWWRFAQCVRRYFDEGRRANPHLLNAGKYSTIWLVVAFSTLNEYYKDYCDASQGNPFFVCWVVSILISTCYLYVWDVKMDWGLFDSKAPPEYKFLREELVYPVKYYYFSIIQDLILRFSWTINLSLTRIGAIPPDLITLVLAPLEIYRRFIWNFYRLENEHLNNCGEFRAVRDISISGQNIDLSALDRILRIMDEPDGLNAFRSRVKNQLASTKKKSLIGEPANPSVVLMI